MRIIFILLFFAGGCSVTKSLPQKGLFSVALLEQQNANKSQLIVYSKSESWISEATYKYIVINGEHVSTITQDTFALIQINPGGSSLRVTQHGYEGVELPTIFLLGSGGYAFKQKFEDTIELHIEPNSTTFVSIDYAEKDISFQCQETETSINICTSTEEGIVLRVEEKEQALAILKGLYEVCHDCK
ncbi:hypothetical protein [Pseudoalteromonas sp. T1lg48]|uniref:hypothetical protein n=1 Tax=Pseudoalteromonas sp. T1lg48 TaxID=2077100 RepID=UPI000CF6B122|nr:hypothetical protein [Pseudoalteromonas sp. T1lg48]